MGIAERDYMRRDDEAPQIRWGYALVIVVSAILVTTFGVQRCSTATGKDRLTKGSLIVNINEATGEELQTLLGVGAARAELIIQNRPYHSIDELVEKRALPRTVVDANRSRLKTIGKTTEPRASIDQKAKGAFVSESALHISMAVSRILSA